MRTFWKSLLLQRSRREKRSLHLLLFAGVKQLLQTPGLADGALHFASVEGLSCQTGFLDGPVSLLTSLLACGSTSDASLAAIQAGQLALCHAMFQHIHERQPILPQHM